MFRYFRALWYLITGRFTKAAEALQSNEYVMAATYDRSISKQEQRFNAVKEAVASLMSIKLTNAERVQQLNAETEKLAKVKAGAGVAAQKRAQELQAAGVDPQKILTDPDIIKHQAAFNDAGSTLKAKEEEIKSLEAQLAERNKQIASYQAELQQMQRSVVQLRQEKHSALADTAIAKQQEAISNMLAGISEDTSDRDLQAARDARSKAQQRAKISADLAGNDAKLAENEYLQYADKVTQDSEFTSLLGLDSGKKEAPAAAEPMQPAQLPKQ